MTKQSLQIWVTLALFRLALTAIVGWLLAQRLLAQFMAAAEMLTAGTRWMR